MNIILTIIRLFYYRIILSWTSFFCYKANRSSNTGSTNQGNYTTVWSRTKLQYYRSCSANRQAKIIITFAQRWACKFVLQVQKSQILKILGSFRIRKSENFWGVPVHKPQIRKFVMINTQIENPQFSSVPQSANRIR